MPSAILSCYSRELSSPRSGRLMEDFCSICSADQRRAVIFGRCLRLAIASRSFLLNSSADENTPLISPNGKWLTYLSDDSSYWELYVQSFTSDGKLGSDRQRIYSNGAISPVW